LACSFLKEEGVKMKWLCGLVTLFLFTVVYLVLYYSVGYWLLNDFFHFVEEENEFD